MITSTAEFTRTLNTLNDEQRQAVEGIHGPWMVLAGPGTGKTHMLAARIGNILLNEQVEPRNIVCLTFTNAGVKAIRDRLLRFIGVPGSRVAVHTFHDFARRVIEDHPGLFENMEWEQMDELDKRRLSNTLIDWLPPKHPLRGPVHEPYKYGPNLLDLFSEMTKESWSVDDVVGAVDEHIANIPNNPNYIYKQKYKNKVAGDLKPIAAEVEAKLEVTKAAARLYDDFAQLKLERGLFDYGDQTTWLRNALRDHESLRFILQEQYQFILVDEYQDTNGLQNEILSLLAEDENPNLFVVGDDDQSIYGFQGARVEGLRELVERYSQDLTAVVLRANYRSHQTLLDAAMHVIDENTTRLTEIGGQQLEKTLREGREGGFAESPKPQVIHYPTELAQAHYVAEQIGAWLAAGTPADEIGVIYRAHRQSARLIDALEQAYIPYRLKRSLNVLTQPVVVRLHKAMAFIGNLRADKPVDNQQAFEFLLSPAIGISPVELAEVNDYRFTQARRVPSWRYLLSHPEVLEGEGIPISNPERYRVAHDLLNELGELVDRYPLPTIIQQIAQRTGLLREALAGDESELALESIDALVRDAHARIQKEPQLTLAGLCATWDELLAYDISMPLVKQADTRDAVSLMTAHSAKGLEFDKVVMYDVTSGKWDANKKRPGAFLLPVELVQEEDKTAKDEENRRLFYVAMTRAREELILTVPGESENGTKQSPSNAIQSLLTEGLADEQFAEVDDKALLGMLAEHYGQELRPVAPLLNVKSAREIWQDQELTLGAARVFEKCKVAFYYQYVSEVPRTKTSIDRFRSAVHSTIHGFYRRALNPEELEFGSEEELVALWTDTLNRERSGMLPEEFENYMEEGEAMLRTWYMSDEDALNLNVVIERSIGLTTPGGLRLKGRIDRIDIDTSTTLGIPVDYKFGEPKEIKYGKKRGNNPMPYRELEDYNWRQLAYYAILMREGFNQNTLPAKGKLVYLGARTTQVVEVELNPAAVALFEEELGETYRAIQETESFSGCHQDPDVSPRDKENCSWCQFHYLKRNSATLVSEEVGVLDDM